MAKQTVAITRCCSKRGCYRDAVIGVYTWSQGATDVDLDRPVRVFCGPHKPKLTRSLVLRNVRLNTRLA